MANPKKVENGIGQEELARRLKMLEDHAGIEPEDEDDDDGDDEDSDPYDSNQDDDDPPHKQVAPPRKTPKRKK